MEISRIRARTKNAVCAYCKERLGSRKQRTCPGCNTRAHHDCWAEFNDCPTLGCSHRLIERPQLRAPTELVNRLREPRGVLRSQLLGVGLLVIGLAIWVIPTLMSPMNGPASLFVGIYPLAVGALLTYWGYWGAKPSPGLLRALNQRPRRVRVDCARPTSSLTQVSDDGYELIFRDLDPTHPQAAPGPWAPLTLRRQGPGWLRRACRRGATFEAWVYRGDDAGPRSSREVTWVVITDDRRQAILSVKPRQTPPPRAG